MRIKFILILICLVAGIYPGCKKEKTSPVLKWSGAYLMDTLAGNYIVSGSCIESTYQPVHAHNYI